MRNHRQKRYYQKGYNDTTWDPPYNGFFDPDNEDTRAAREAYREGWDDSVQITGKPNGWSIGGVALIIAGVVLVVVLLMGMRDGRITTHAPPANTYRVPDIPAPDLKHCSWQWRYTGRWLSNDDNTWYREWYYTGSGFWGYDGLWHREWSYTGRWLPNNDNTWRREQKQFWTCS